MARASTWTNLLLLAWRHALQNMRQSLALYTASTLSIALSLSLVGLAVMSLQNLDRLTAGWGKGVHVIVYLDAEAAEQRVQALVRLLRGRPEVSAVRHVTSAMARERLQASMGLYRKVLDEVEAGFLPASLELRLRRDQPDRARALVSLLNASTLVEEVDYMGEWARRLDALVALSRGLTLAVALIAGLACLYIVGSTIRLGVHARADEIAILRLVGATNAFIRGPLLIEGALQGLLGAGLAAGLLYLLYRAGAPWLQAQLSFVFSAVQVTFLGPRALLTGLGAGTLLGLLGSRLALGRYIED